MLVSCVCCQEWVAFEKHGHVKESGWQRVEGSRSWIHSACLPEWEANASEISEERWDARKRRNDLEFLFSQHDLLQVYHGVLLRYAPSYEHTHYGLLDDLEAGLNADAGMERMRQVIDEMVPDLRPRLVAAGFVGYQGGHHIMLGWVDSIPPEYDNVELEHIDDVRVQSVLVDDLPRVLRDMLPEPVRSRV